MEKTPCCQQALLPWPWSAPKPPLNSSMLSRRGSKSSVAYSRNKVLLAEEEYTQESQIDTKKVYTQPHIKKEICESQNVRTVLKNLHKTVCKPHAISMPLYISNSKEIKIPETNRSFPPTLKNNDFHITYSEKTSEETSEGLHSFVLNSVNDSKFQLALDKSIEKAILDGQNNWEYVREILNDLNLSLVDNSFESKQMMATFQREILNEWLLALDQKNVVNLNKEKKIEEISQDASKYAARCAFEAIFAVQIQISVASALIQAATELHSQGHNPNPNRNRRLKKFKKKYKEVNVFQYDFEKSTKLLNSDEKFRENFATKPNDTKKMVRKSQSTSINPNPNFTTKESKILSTSKNVEANSNMSKTNISKEARELLALSKKILL